MRVWQYWEGSKPSYISTCLDSVTSHSVTCEHNLVTDATAYRYVDNQLLHSKWRTLRSPVFRADAIRAALMYKYGGLYVDADTVGLRPLSMFDPADNEVCYLKWPHLGTVLNGYIYCKPSSNFSAAWLESVNKSIGDNVDLLWAELGEKTITPLIESGRYRSSQLPLSTFLPIDVSRHRDDPNEEWCGAFDFFEKGDFHPFVTEHSLAFGLNHSLMFRLFNSVMTGDMQGDTVVESLIRFARSGGSLVQ